MNRFFALTLALLICAGNIHAAEDADSAIVRDFEKRVSAYAHLRKNVEAALPPFRETRSPAEISLAQRDLAAAIRKSRENARAGDIFTPPIAELFRRRIGAAMQADGKRIESTLREAEPVKLRVGVNDSYPAGIPLQSTPPTLLSDLPRLPRQIEYRLAGRDLILLDVKANLAIDLIENAVS